MNESPNNLPHTQMAGNKPEVSTSTRPKQVTIAAALLWVSFVLKPILLVGFVFVSEAEFQTVALGIPLILIAIYTIVFVQVYRGENWARIVSLILIVFAMILLLSSTEEDGALGVAELAFSAVRISFQLIAIFLLFISPGALWFRSRA